jgi:predicted small lipoprotein YifL
MRKTVIYCFTLIAVVAALSACGRMEPTELEPLSDMPPVTVITGPTRVSNSCPSPRLTKLDGSTSYDPDGTIVRYLWNFGDGSHFESENAYAYHRFVNPKDSNFTFLVTLTTWDNTGNSSKAEFWISMSDLDLTISICTLPSDPGEP